MKCYLAQVVNTYNGNVTGFHPRKVTLAEYFCCLFSLVVSYLRAVPVAEDSVALVFHLCPHVWPNAITASCS